MFFLFFLSHVEFQFVFNGHAHISSQNVYPCLVPAAAAAVAAAAVAVAAAAATEALDTSK